MMTEYFTILMLLLMNIIRDRCCSLSIFSFENITEYFTNLIMYILLLPQDTFDVATLHFLSRCPRHSRRSTTTMLRVLLPATHQARCSRASSGTAPCTRTARRVVLCTMRHGRKARRRGALLRTVCGRLQRRIHGSVTMGATLPLRGGSKFISAQPGRFVVPILIGQGILGAFHFFYQDVVTEDFTNK